MRILGLDPGSLHTGFGIIDKQGSRLRAVAHGRISCAAGQPLAARLARLAGGLEKILAEHRPDAVALEALYRGVNPRSLIVLAQARGALLAVLGRAGSAIAEYAPAEIKTALTGNGRADKQQVARMVRLVLELGETPLSADASDALAVAVCFAQRARLDRLRAGERSAGE